eukprot:CAMPEP_0201629730 /NCGR_PEP_ID=MMETSP0493-20130528/4294_1 /ASSEMBLY_ACC=CAM_ASM_000838 /TAXON_ID=420259 /ORGANISM="Thalassiosira gravida, Strain GMp14c1" /LENGTH=588 /DNA_ID=CAMNT_0048100771 /DNA_START=304 /DNA_END=2070 /DNA_ORIENTATION=-
MNALVPSFILFILLIASVAATVVFFHFQLHSLRLTYQGDIATVNDSLRQVQSQQSTYVQQVKTLTKLVSESLNATDEYIQNITNTVSETKDVITENMATVQDIQHDQNSLMAVQFAGMFTLLVILVSGYHLSQHVRHMHSPVVQRKIMAVLWMTPIYSMSCWLSMVFVNAEPYLGVIREFYESYCVYMFLSFLIAVLGSGDRRAVVDLLEEEEKANHLARPDKCRCGPKFWKRCWRSCCNRSKPPMTNLNSERTIDEHGNYVSPERIKAEAVLDQCQTYAMQFVLLRPLTAIGWLVSNQLFEPKQFLDPTTPQLYITIITNGSIFFAFRGLVRFYHATRSNLAWCNPWPKFLCIKGVVFMTFWQKMMLSLIVNLGYSDKFETHEDAGEFIMQAQNFLICLEMLFSAVAHCFVFSPDEWAEGYREREDRRRRNATASAFGDSVALGDFISDVRVVMASKKRRKRRKKVQDGGLSPSSTGEEEEEEEACNDLNLSDSSDEGVLMTAVNLKNEPTSTLNGIDKLGLNLSMDSDEYMMPLSTPSPAGSQQRKRLDTGGSVDSDGGAVIGSLARIEQFIHEHSPKPDDENKIV